MASDDDTKRRAGSRIPRARTVVSGTRKKADGVGRDVDRSASDDVRPEGHRSGRQSAGSGPMAPPSSLSGRDDDEPNGIVEVVVVQWPAERAEVEKLARVRIPRLLLVRPDADPPIAVDSLEDWIRMPCDDRDIRSRLEGLRERALLLLSPPIVEDDGRLIYGGRWVYLDPVRSRLAATLIERFESVVPEEVLIERGWVGIPRSKDGLRATMGRLRSQLRPIGLEVRALSKQGWILHRVRSIQMRQRRLDWPPGQGARGGSDRAAPGAGE